MSAKRDIAMFDRLRQHDAAQERKIALLRSALHDLIGTDGKDDRACELVHHGKMDKHSYDTDEGCPVIARYRELLKQTEKKP